MTRDGGQRDVRNRAGRATAATPRGLALLLAFAAAVVPGLAWAHEPPRNAVFGSFGIEWPVPGTHGGAAAGHTLFAQGVYDHRMGDLRLLLGGGAEVGLRRDAPGATGAPQPYLAPTLQAAWDLHPAPVVVQLTVAPLLFLGPLPAGGSPLGFVAELAVNAPWRALLPRYFDDYNVLTAMAVGCGALVTFLLPSGIGLRVEHFPDVPGVQVGITLTWLWPFN